MKRRVKDSTDWRTFFYNYGGNLSVLITYMQGEGDFPYNEYDLEDFLNQCDSIAESINGYYNILTCYDNSNGDCFKIEFWSTTPIGVEPEDYIEEGEQVGEVKFKITLIPDDIIATQLQDAYESRRF